MESPACKPRPIFWASPIVFLPVNGTLSVPDQERFGRSPPLSVRVSCAFKGPSTRMWCCHGGRGLGRYEVFFSVAGSLGPLSFLFLLPSDAFRPGVCRPRHHGTGFFRRPVASTRTPGRWVHDGVELCFQFSFRPRSAPHPVTRKRAGKVLGALSGNFPAVKRFGSPLRFSPVTPSEPCGFFVSVKLKSVGIHRSIPLIYFQLSPHFPPFLFLIVFGCNFHVVLNEG